MNSTTSSAPTATSSHRASTSGASASRPYALRPIARDAAEALRARGGEVHVATRHPGYPCRQCLRDAAVGEELILVSHDPFQLDSPYRSASPIFLHREDCGRPATDDGLPVQLTGRQLSIRAFDETATMIDAAVVLDGTDLDAALVRMFEDDATDEVHVHYLPRGCWALTVEPGQFQPRLST